MARVHRDDTAAVTAIEPLSYWEDGALQRPPLPQPRAHRYLTFDIDLGGLNNIRLVFEYVAVIAAITGRTLVLPPCQPWYLINFGPISGGEPGGCTHLGDVFDLRDLNAAIRIQTTAEFIGEAGGHLSIPGRFSGAQAQQLEDATDPDQLASWRDWLFQHTEIVPWNPHDTLICMPDIAGVLDRNVLTEDYVDGRQLVEFTPLMSAAPVIHFPCRESYRSLGPVATMLASRDSSLPRASRALLKHHLHYRPEIFAAASRCIDQLGLDRYDAIHVRRNDFQYQQTRLNAEAILDNCQPLLDAGLPLYIATDENDDSFFEALAERHKVYRWQDLVGETGLDTALPYAWIGPIEQIICAGAHRFVGTDLSTFSTYINRLRGYRNAPDTQCYYHSTNYRDAQAVAASRVYRGREYLRENPLFWTDC